MRSSSEDIELIKKVLEGEHHCFDTLVAHYEQFVFSAAYSFLRNRQAAEDVTQDVFVSAYRRLASFEGRSAFGTWLRKITFHQCIDYRRRQQSRPASSFDEGMIQIADAHAATPAHIAEGNELVQGVRAAIDTLSDEQRNIIVLREMQGLDYAEIADILRIPVGTVRSRLHRARLELKDVLQRLGLQATPTEASDVKEVRKSSVTADSATWKEPLDLSTVAPSDSVADSFTSLHPSKKGKA